MSERYPCLVVDHDDTSVMSTPSLHYPAHVEALRLLRPGLEPIDLEGWLSKNFDPGLMQYLHGELGMDEGELRTNYRVWREYTSSRVPDFFPGLLDIYAEHKRRGGALVVISHSAPEMIERDYRAAAAGGAALVEPDLVFGWDDDPGKRKPHPYPLLETMRRLGYKAGEILVLDDLKPGADMAASAGVDFAAACWGHSIPLIRDAMRERGGFFLERVEELRGLLFGGASPQRDEAWPAGVVCVPMDTLLSRRSIDGIDKLALAFPAGALKGAGSALSAAMGEEGWLVCAAPGAGGAQLSAQPWLFETLIREGEEAFLIGPDSMGEAASLDEDPGLGAGGSLSSRLGRLVPLSRALAFLSAGGHLPRGLVSSGILFSKEGERILLLPSAALAKALSARGAAARRAARRAASLSSPLAGGAEAQASFILAQAVYRIASGRPVFEPESGDPGAARASSRPHLSLSLAAPRLQSSLASLADRALADPGKAPLAEWVAALEKAQASGWTRELGAEEEAELERQRSQAEARERRAASRSAFWRRRGALVLAAGAVLLVFGLVLGDIARAQRDRPNFSSLAPRELAQRYYKALDALDMESLEACGDKRAIKEDDNFVINLTVITKTRMAYEGKSPIVQAAGWLAAGRPALGPGSFLFGITGLVLSGGEMAGAAAGGAAPGGEASPPVSITAEYSFWTIDRGQEPSGKASATSAAADSAPTLPLEERRVDRLVLERGKRGWAIKSIERSVAP